jgi:hypothetical protein
MRRLLLALAGLLLCAPPAAAQVVYPPTASAVLGTYTIATLPTCNAGSQGKYAFATDLGGGADTVLCDGTYWKHIRLGSPSIVAATAGTIAITPLTSAPLILVQGTITGTMSLAISTTNLYPGYILYVRVPGAITGALGVSVGGGASLPILGNTTSMFVWDGTTLQRMQ